MTEVRGFFGEYRFLSNFYPSPFIIDGFRYPTNEHFFQAMKGNNSVAHDYILGALTPAIAKSRARGAEIRDDWNKVRIAVMRKGLRAKFEQNPELKAALMATDGMELIEENSWGDTFWGQVDGVGYNHLGEMLMELRDSFKMEKFFE